MTKDKIDRLNVKVSKEQRTEEYKRSGHPDFMTAKELKDSNFSGLRSNSITNNAEIWMLGELRAVVTPYDLDKDPQAINKAFENLFMLDNILPDTEQARLYGRYRDEEANSKSLILLPDNIRKDN